MKIGTGTSPAGFVLKLSVEKAGNSEIDESCAEEYYEKEDVEREREREREGKIRRIQQDEVEDQEKRCGVECQQSCLKDQSLLNSSSLGRGALSRPEFDFLDV
jgi:hypothetical protein